MLEREVFEEKFLNAKFIHKEIEDQIIKDGILTGSYAFGCQTEHSDIDIIILNNNNNNNETVLQFLQDSFYFDKPYSYSESANYYAKFRSYDRPVNVIFFQEPIFYNIWKNANEKFIKVLNESDSFKELIKDKFVRVELFESFKRIEVNTFNKKESKNV